MKAGGGAARQQAKPSQPNAHCETPYRRVGVAVAGVHGVRDTVFVRVRNRAWVWGVDLADMGDDPGPVTVEVGGRGDLRPARVEGDVAAIGIACVLDLAEDVGIPERRVLGVDTE